jgi:hypothetical protein
MSTTINQVTPVNNSLVNIDLSSYSGGSGTWAMTTNPGEYGGQIYNTSYVDGDYLQYTMWLNAGTYTIYLMLVKGLSGGLFYVTIDGTTVMSGTAYAGTGSYNNRFTQANIIISTPRFAVIRFYNHQPGGSLGLQTATLVQTG